MDLSVIPYNADTDDGQVIHSKSRKLTSGDASAFQYMECMKNHAASLGGHANDGCGEFMPYLDPTKALTCAACGCHRNFHRRVSPTDHRHHHPPSLLTCNASPTTILWDGKCAIGVPPQHRRIQPPPQVDLGGVAAENDECNGDSRSDTPERGNLKCYYQIGGTAVMGGHRSNKRFRTKFTAEQKDRMLQFAERVGWRLIKQNEALLNHFCSEVGVKRNVFKVWMHNNKYGHRRRDGVTSPLIAPVALPHSPSPALATQLPAGI